jgi:very-short-patch-repair endonuclease
VLEPEDWVQRGDGIRVASPARAWFDCARDIDDNRFERLTEWVLDQHASVPTLWRMRRRLNVRGRPGLARVNRVLSRRAVWQRPDGSGRELEVLNALDERGVRGIVRQHPISLPNGVVVHPDGALPEIRWAVEIDHVTWHGGRLDARRDKGRDHQLRRVGWQVDRVTDVEIRERFDVTIAELVELVELRRRSLAA